jgi:hypothetical protein
MSGTAAGAGLLPPPPAAALDARGRLQAGAFAGEPAGAERIALAPGMGRLRGLAARALRRRKRWIWVGVFAPRVFAGFAVVDAGYLGSAFAYVVDREAPGGVPVEAAWLAPLAAGFRVEGSLTGGVAAARLPLRGRIAIRGEGGSLSCTASLGRIEADLRIERLDVPLGVISDLGGGLPGATTKVAGVAVRGRLARAGREIPLEDAFAAADWTCAIFPYETCWRWALASGRDAAGRAVGLNLCRGVHDGPAQAHTENALWLEGRPAAVAPVEVSIGAGAHEEWRVAARDGSVALAFRPAGERREDLNLGAVASRFRQAFGTWHGRLIDRAGRACDLDGTPGVAEDHSARW